MRLENKSSNQILSHGSPLRSENKFSNQILSHKTSLAALRTQYNLKSLFLVGSGQINSGATSIFERGMGQILILRGWDGG